MSVRSKLLKGVKDKFKDSAMSAYKTLAKKNNRVADFTINRINSNIGKPGGMDAFADIAKRSLTAAANATATNVKRFATPSNIAKTIIGSSALTAGISAGLKLKDYNSHALVDSSLDSNMIDTKSFLSKHSPGTRSITSLNDIDNIKMNAIRKINIKLKLAREGISLNPEVIKGGLFGSGDSILIARDKTNKDRLGLMIGESRSSKGIMDMFRSKNDILMGSDKASPINVNRDLINAELGINKNKAIGEAAETGAAIAGMFL